MTGVLHMGYSLTLQAGYRVSDLSLVYPLARGTGPLLSFLAATFILHEPANLFSVLGVLLIVGGILLVSGLANEAHKAPRAGIALGVLTGVFIAGYTINDGWAVKTLMLSPFIIDFTGNMLRLDCTCADGAEGSACFACRVAKVSWAHSHRRRARTAGLHPGCYSR